VVTAGGTVFHRSTKCAALLEGQGYARAKGLNVHDAHTVPLTEVLGARGACEACFPGYRGS
jgi:hypothetical protein